MLPHTRSSIDTQIKRTQKHMTYRRRVYFTMATLIERDGAHPLCAFVFRFIILWYLTMNNNFANRHLTTLALSSRRPRARVSSDYNDTTSSRVRSWVLSTIRRRAVSMISVCLLPTLGGAVSRAHWYDSSTRSMTRRVSVTQNCVATPGWACWINFSVKYHHGAVGTKENFAFWGVKVWTPYRIQTSPPPLERRRLVAASLKNLVRHMPFDGRNKTLIQKDTHDFRVKNVLSLWRVTKINGISTKI